MKPITNSTPLPQLKVKMKTRQGIECQLNNLLEDRHILIKAIRTLTKLPSLDILKYSKLRSLRTKLSKLDIQINTLKWL